MHRFGVIFVLVLQLRREVYAHMVIDDEEWNACFLFSSVLSQIVRFVCDSTASLYIYFTFVNKILLSLYSARSDYG